MDIYCQSYNTQSDTNPEKASDAGFRLIYGLDHGKNSDRLLLKRRSDVDPAIHS